MSCASSSFEIMSNICSEKLSLRSTEIWLYLRPINVTNTSAIKHVMAQYLSEIVTELDNLMVYTDNISLLFKLKVANSCTL